MRYMGSKNRIAKYIAPIIQEAIDTNGITTYCEPFVGGANMMDKIVCENRIGNDIHPQLIAMWNALVNGWIPPEHISEEEYHFVKDHQTTLPPYYVGYVGFAASFGARYFEGYARGFKNDGITQRDISNECWRNIMRQIEKLKNVSFISGDYKDIEINDAVIYCDPPYENTKRYSSTRIFNYEDFWKWCREQNKGNILFVSGYDAPPDFECIWQKDVIVNFDSKRDEKSNKKRIEKLFVLSK